MVTKKRRPSLLRVYRATSCINLAFNVHFQLTEADSLELTEVLFSWADSYDAEVGMNEENP